MIVHRQAYNLPRRPAGGKNGVSAKAEGLTFDRKSAAIDPRRLAETMAAFANADGGTVAIGIRDRKFEGIHGVGNAKINAVGI